MHSFSVERLLMGITLRILEKLPRSTLLMISQTDEKRLLITTVVLCTGAFSLGLDSTLFPLMMLVLIRLI